MPSPTYNYACQKQARNRILAAEVRTKTDIQIECRALDGFCFLTLLPRSDRPQDNRETIRHAYAEHFGCSIDIVQLSSFDSNKQAKVYGPVGRELGKATVSLADHDADKRRRAE